MKKRIPSARPRIEARHRHTQVSNSTGHVVRETERAAEPGGSRVVFLSQFFRRSGCLNVEQVRSAKRAARMGRQLKNAVQRRGGQAGEQRARCRHS